MNNKRLALLAAIMALLMLIVSIAPVLAESSIHIVQRGETLYSIARRYGTTVSAIMQANALSNPNWIYVGQRLTIPGGASPAPTPVPSSGQTTYVVKTGDTLFQIAVRFGVSLGQLAQANGIINPSLIYVGQQLIIPGTGSDPTPAPAPSNPTPTPTPSPGTGFYYTVQSGDTLFRIATRYGVSASVIAAANNLTNINFLYVGQQLWIPAGGSQPPAPTPPSPAPAPPTNTGFGYGIQVHLLGQDADQVLGAVNELGFGWIKQQIEWKVFEPVRGQIQWDTLDAIVNAADAHNLKILFSVVKAPAWARNTTQEDGPPTNYQDYWTFVGALASRYAGRVDAYEIWNEQNLRREWNGDTLSAARYVQLLAGAYNAVKAADQSAVVISGALAPTGWNDGVTAIDDRVYLDAMYTAGLKNYCDALGAHPNGWANGANALCCGQEADVPSHNDHKSFFFRETLNDYRTIMVRHGDSPKRIWATEFGWGSIAGLGGTVQTGYEFVQYNSEAEQSANLTQAFSIARATNYVGVMFVWNLNFCPVAGPDAEQCYWGIVRPDWSHRPAYEALRAMPKP